MAVRRPGHPIERISDLLVRAGLVSCQDATDLYNNILKGTLGLWTTLTLRCENNQLVVR